jgi:hypothetical protein
MKKLLFSAVFLVFAITVNGQDYIILRNGDEIKSKVLELGQSEIKYKKYDNIDGPSYVFAKSDVFMIKYENGTKDIITPFQSDRSSSDEEIQKSNSYSSTSMGHFYLSPETSLSFGRSVYSDSNDTYDIIRLNSTAGYFIVDNLLTAISLGYTFSNVTTSSGSTTENNSFAFGFQMRYYILGKIFGGVGYSGRKLNDDPINNYVDLELGYAGFVTKNISIEPSFTYMLKIGEKTDKINAFGINLGLGIYF